jgi:hypothetical protein
LKSGIVSGAVLASDRPRIVDTPAPQHGPDDATTVTAWIRGRASYSKRTVTCVTPVGSTDWTVYG